MKKLLFVALLVLTLSGCNLFSSSSGYVMTEVYEGIDTVEINTEWIDAGAEISVDYDQLEIEVNSTVDITQVGLYKVEYSKEVDGTSYMVERYVMVVDSIAPVITLTPGLDTIILGTDWVDAGVTIQDNSLETLSYTVDGSVDANTVGRYVITYSVTDSSGNNSSIDRVVNVVS